MAVGKFRVRLEGDGINIDRSIDPSTAVRLMAALMDVAAGGDMTGSPSTGGGQPDPPPQEQTPPAGNGAVSLREYLDAHDAKRNVEKIVAIGEYLKTHRGVDVFKSADLEKGFRDASEAVPGNLGRDVGWAKRNGWIAPGEKRGEYYVTDTGRKALKAKFPADIKKSTAKPRARRRRSKP
jgi:hypothetical protein